MEPNIYFFNNIKDTNISSNKDSQNQNSISGKIINMNNNQQVTYDFYEPLEMEKEKEKDNTIEEELKADNKKLDDFLTKELINKMTLISPIPQKNLPNKNIIKEVLMQEKEESFEEKEEESLSPDEEEESDDSDFENFKNDEVIKVDKVKSGKDNNKKIVHFKLDENKDNNRDKKEKNDKNLLNRTFSYNNNNKKENLSDHISSFFYLTTKHLKEELKNENSFYSDFNKSHNYIPKYSFELNNSGVNQIKNSNNSNLNNNLSINNEINQNDSLNFNINPQKILTMKIALII